LAIVQLDSIHIERRLEMADNALRKDVGEEMLDSDVLPKGGNTFSPELEVEGGQRGDDAEVERVERVYK
jgi:hypothetical protein